jgi:hypothetical protein
MRGTQTEGVWNRVVRRRYAPKRNEVTGRWIKFVSLLVLFAKNNYNYHVKYIEMYRACSTNCLKMNEYRVFV